ncbi:MAG: hypothetical protein ACXVEE_29995 [Polyangiales bacterium]
MKLDALLKSPKRAHAYAQQGLASAEVLLDAIRNERHPAIGYLENVLFEVRAPELVELYAPLLASEEDVLLGMRALAATRDPRALPHLVKCLRDPEHAWRDRAAAAIATLAVPAGAAPLLEYARELLPSFDEASVHALADRCAIDWEMRPLRAAIAMAVGLARLGDHRLAVVPITLVEHEYPKRTDRIEQLAVRIEAASALRHVVGPGLSRAIAACIRGRDVECARSGAFAAFLVGTEPMVSLLVEATKKRDHELKNNAPIWLHRLFAHDERYEEKTPRALRSFLEERPHIPEGVSFRMGKPRDERDVVELLAGDLASDALAELRITLGLEASTLLDARYQPQLMTQARALVAARPLAEGCLHRHGHAFDPASS